MDMTDPNRDETISAGQRREAEFHDRAAKFYSVTVSSKGYYLSRILEDCASQEVLEYGCGPEGYSRDLAGAGAIITGVDISENAVELARQQAIEGKFDDRASFHVMDAEALELFRFKFPLFSSSQ